MTRNIVWGYDFISMLGTSTHSGYGISQSAAQNAAVNYAKTLSDMANVSLPNAAAQTQAQADWQRSRGQEELDAGNTELAADWFAAADANDAKAQADRDSIPAYTQAAAIAAQYTWRLPTQAEAQAALSSGLFTYGVPGFAGYDGSPYVGAQVPWNNLTWSSTLSKRKTEAWAYRPLDGSNGFVTVGSQVNAIFVRTHSP